MAYIKYKELTKFFNFSKHIQTADLPYYIYDYVFDDEKVLVSYKTFRDHGVFTTEKIVLFDNRLSFRPFKEIYTIPYHNVSALYIRYKSKSVDLHFDLESGHQVQLKFVNVNRYDKARLRLLYSYICRYINKQKIPSDLVDTLIEDKIELRGDN